MLLSYTFLCYYWSMIKAEINAYAKINLTLDVLNKREDGYHNLRSVMHTIDIFDSVFITKQRNITSSSNIRFDQPSAAQRAAEAYAEAFKTSGAHIEVFSRIPVMAGLGGSSATAAAVLNGMQKLYAKARGNELYGLAKKLGADVPFALMGGCALAEGIGEKLTPLPPAELCLLIVKKNGGISTGALFGSLELPVRHPDTETAVSAIKNGDKDGLIASIHNALEIKGIQMNPEIGSLIQRLEAAGARRAFMTGAGSAVVGVFEDAAETERAKNLFSDCEYVQPAKTIYDMGE